MRSRLALGVWLVLQACVSTPAPRVVKPSNPGPWWQGAVFYEVFVRSFKDSNADGTGDLNGLIEKLDYLNDADPSTTTDLGVDALWLMPVFESPSYHGYDTTDYERIEPDYGSNADFDRLLAEAHKRGIKIIVDLVLNHTSAEHPWFVDSAASPSAAKRDWYVWSKTDLGWGQPWNEHGSTWHQRGDAYFYGLFWEGMPDLNFRNQAVRNEMTRVAVSWAKKGVDGFRLDAIRHLIETGPGVGQGASPENHVYLKELASALRAVNPHIALVGEVWSSHQDIAPYFGDGTDELQMLFDFPLAGALVNGVWSGDATTIIEQLRETQQLYPAKSVNAPFLTNHDQVRLATAMSKEAARLRLAAAVLLTLNGAPFIYYGEELGLPNGPGNDDKWKRTPMQWNSSANAGFSTHAPWQASDPTQLVTPAEQQASNADSLLSRYRALIRARHASAALTQGALQVLDAGTPKVLAFSRSEPNEFVVVAHNLSASPQTVTLAAPGTEAESLFVDPRVTATKHAGAWLVSLPPLSTGVFRLK